MNCSLLGNTSEKVKWNKQPIIKDHQESLQNLSGCFPSLRPLAKIAVFVILPHRCWGNCQPKGRLSRSEWHLVPGAGGRSKAYSEIVSCLQKLCLLWLWNELGTQGRLAAVTFSSGRVKATMVSMDKAAFQQDTCCIVVFDMHETHIHESTR